MFSPLQLPTAMRNANVCSGFTALCLAARCASVEVVQILLDQQASLSLCSPASGTEAALPLHHAVEAGSADIAQALLTAGADAMAEDGHGWSALARAHQSQNCSVLQCIREAVTTRAAKSKLEAVSSASEYVPHGLFLDDDKGSETSELSCGLSSDDSDGFVVE